MVWPFSNKKTVVNTRSEEKAEEELLKELPEDLGQFLKFKSREQTRLIDKNPDEDYQHFKDLNPSKNIAVSNCADYHVALMNCLSNGSTGDKLTMCSSHSNAFQNCYKFQKNIIVKLGIENVESEKKYREIERGADDIGIKWFSSKVDEPESLSQTALIEVYDKRDEIWK